MNVTFRCPRCDQSSRVNLPVEEDHFDCPQCHAQFDAPIDAWSEGRLKRCLVCPSHDLYVRKDFPQRLGVGIVVFGFTASCVTWYLHWINETFIVLFATALVDVVLYALVGNSVMCYRCGAQYRGLEGLEGIGAFDLEVHERHRQQLARLAQAAPNTASQSSTQPTAPMR